MVPGMILVGFFTRIKTVSGVYFSGASQKIWGQTSTIKNCIKKRINSIEKLRLFIT